MEAAELPTPISLGRRDGRAHLGALLVARLRAQSEGLKSGLKASELGGETTPG